MDLSELFNELKNRTDEGSRFYREIIVTNEYRIDLTKQYKVIVDIGANLGDFCYLLYNNAEILYAIEANKANYDILAGYVEKYNLTKIKPFHLAMAGQDGVRKLYEHQGCGGYSIAIGSRNVVEEVPAKTLNTFFAENNIDSVDILKIDVEGAEREIFDGSVEALKKIAFIVGENHGVPESTLRRSGFSFSLANANFWAKKIVQ